MKLKNDEILKIIMEQVCLYFALTPSELFKPNTRKREYVYPRQVFHYLSRRHTKCSLESIGEFSKDIGNTYDHSTVHHSYKTTKGFIEHNPEIMRDVLFIEKKVCPMIRPRVNKRLYLKRMQILQILRKSPTVEILDQELMMIL